MSTGVNDAIKKARDAGLYVIALDTPTDPPDAVDITFATDNREAGKLIGQYTAAKLDGKKTLIVIPEVDDNLLLAARNIPNVLVQRVWDLNTYSLLNADNVGFTDAAVKALTSKPETAKAAGAKA